MVSLVRFLCLIAYKTFVGYLAQSFPYWRNRRDTILLYTHDLRNSMNERTHFFIKIYLSHFILERVMFLVCERCMERHILRVRTSSHIFFQEPGVPTLAPPCKLVGHASDRLRVSRSTAILCTLSKSHRVVLITWSPSGYTPVRPKWPDAQSSSNQNVTAYQSTRGHWERTKNPCHMLYNNSTFS